MVYTEELWRGWFNRGATWKNKLWEVENIWTTIIVEPKGSIQANGKQQRARDCHKEDRGSSRIDPRDQGEKGTSDDSRAELSN